MPRSWPRGWRSASCFRGTQLSWQDFTSSPQPLPSAHPLGCTPGGVRQRAVPAVRTLKDEADTTNNLQLWRRYRCARGLVSALLDGKQSERGESFLACGLGSTGRGRLAVGKGGVWFIFFPSCRSLVLPLHSFFYYFCIFQVLHSSCKHHLKINFP